jgi:PII-like signaling protein
MFTLPGILSQKIKYAYLKILNAYLKKSNISIITQDVVFMYAYIYTLLIGFYKQSDIETDNILDYVDNLISVYEIINNLYKTSKIVSDISSVYYSTIIQIMKAKSPVLAYMFDNEPLTNFGTTTLVFSMPATSSSATIVKGVNNSRLVTGSNAMVYTSLAALPNLASIEIWAKPNQTANLNCILYLGSGTGTGSFNLRLLHNTGLLLDQQTGLAATYRSYTLLNCIAANTTYYLVINKNVNTYTVYLNGVLRTWNSSQDFLAYGTTTPHLQFGRSYNARNFQGNLGLFALHHDRNLTQTEITAHYNLGLI